MKLRINAFSFLLLLICSFSYGQIKEYTYKRELKGVSEQWHKIILPNDIFEKIAQDLNDIRIYGITTTNDTIEAPYLLHLKTEKTTQKEVAFKIINTSHNDKGYYYTFEILTSEPINQIKLDFKQKNFDWRVKLEGSQNQNEWFTIADNYRVLSIENKSSSFHYTDVLFPSSKYRYFRLLINSNEKPELTLASISQQETITGTLINYSIKKFEVKENKELKQTEIEVDIDMPVPVCQMKLAIADTFDYYRPITIKYLVDSFKTEQGWKYNYSTLTSGTLNSIEKNEFTCNSTTAQKLKFIISNGDNRPLHFEKLMVTGYVHELVARFTEKASYFLVYGNKAAKKPSYDIDRFADKLPDSISLLELGNEQLIEKAAIEQSIPLFKNKAWLWAVMGLIIVVIGGFTIKMMRNS